MNVKQVYSHTFGQARWLGCLREVLLSVFAIEWAKEETLAQQRKYVVQDVDEW